MVPQEYRDIRGARESTLQNVSWRIPKRKITIFTGKSANVFDTIRLRAEARRQTAFGPHRKG
jgi:excinuclease UvrABC ATPase subunit